MSAFARMVEEYRRQAMLEPEEARAAWALEVLASLDARGDPESTHEMADALLCAFLPPEAAEAFERLTRWYA